MSRVLLGAAIVTVQADEHSIWTAKICDQPELAIV
jgi:hypothetical protein